MQRTIRNLAAGAAAALTALPAAAQVTNQILSISFVTIVTDLPLSDAFAPVAALLLAAASVYLIRRRTPGARLFAGLLAICGLAAVMSTGDRSPIREAHALIAPQQLSLTVSPATIDVGPFLPQSPLNVLATNNTGKNIVITAVDLAVGPYSEAPGTTCIVGIALPPGGTCLVALSAGQVND